jgi:mannitol-1-phosphate/altronate dehydrogenase
MSTDSVYKQAIKRVFAKKYHDGRMAVYWGRDDNTIHVIASLGHYVHKIARENEDTLEFVNSVGDRIVVALTNEERLQIERSG